MTMLKYNTNKKFKIMQITDIQEVPKISPDTKKLLNAVIEQDGCDNNRQIAGVKVAVKRQGHSQQKRHRQRIPVKAVQSKVANQAKGQEQKDKNIGIKEQVALSSL